MGQNFLTRNRGYWMFATDLAEYSAVFGVVEVAALVLLQRLHDDLIVVAVSARRLGPHVHVLRVRPVPHITCTTCQHSLTQLITDSA